MSVLSPNPNAIKVGDTNPLVVVLSDADGPVNLSGCDVQIRISSKVPGSGHDPIVGLCEIIQGVDGNGRITDKGKVRYRWRLGETEVQGVYAMEFGVTLVDGTQRTFPNSGAITFEIEPATA